MSLADWRKPEWQPAEQTRRDQLLQVAAVLLQPPPLARPPRVRAAAGLLPIAAVVLPADCIMHMPKRGRRLRMLRLCMSRRRGAWGVVLISCSVAGDVAVAREQRLQRHVRLVSERRHLTSPPAAAVALLGVRLLALGARQGLPT